MRTRYISVCLTLLTMPAFAASYLPTVDLTSGGVSARSAFGAPAKIVEQKPVISKNVVSRSAKKSVAAPVAQSVENIAMGGDILLPNRPSDNLWASTPVANPLRMPRADEFAVYRSEDSLPEESLDFTFSASQSTPAVVSRPEPKMPSEMDMQIARLNELQRRADESVREKPIQITSPIVARVDEPVVEKSEPVKISRMVVPMDRDVVARAVEKTASPKIAAVRDDMTSMSPTELRKAFRKTFLSENKHLSAYQIDSKFDTVSDMSSFEGFTSERDLSEAGGIRPLEIKIKFRNDDSALSRDNFNLLTEYAGIVVNNPKRAIQIAIPSDVTTSSDARKLAARRLAIVEQVLHDTGVSEQRIMPVLSSRDEEGFVLRIISSDQYETMTKQQKNMFGDTVSKKTYKSMSW